MIDFGSIEITLKKLDSEYNSKLSDSDFQLPVLISKLSVLELCGWIETSLDQVLYEYIERIALDDINLKKIKGIIKKNHGFGLDSHLFPLFCDVIGIKLVNDLYNSLNTTDYLQLQTITDKYSVLRNKAAHTDTPSGVTRNYNSPSIVIGDYLLIKPVFSKIENFIQNINWP